MGSFELGLGNSSVCPLRLFLTKKTVASCSWSGREIRNAPTLEDRGEFSGSKIRYNMLQPTNLITLQETITYPTKREKENHRLKSADWDGIC